MPPLDDFMPYLQQIWQSRNLTNGGTFHQQLESALAQYLRVPYVSLFSNATIALIVATQALRIRGEVITTPFSFVATANSVLWNQLDPIFVDIDKYSCNIDPDKIEQAITPKTSLILPVHVYGRPCATTTIEQISQNYGLRCIYDAAHAFAVNDYAGSVLLHGDLSILSFHATKVFHTFEGGAIISHDLSLKKRIDFLKNFGFSDETTIIEAGINGKMNEFQAAFGLLQLNSVEQHISQRKHIDCLYRHGLQGVPGIRLLDLPNTGKHNYSYFPIFISSPYHLSRDGLYEKLKKYNVFTRRYFYPLISNMSMYRTIPSAAIANLPVANQVAQEVLCLPIYPDLSDSEVNRIIELVASK